MIGSYGQTEISHGSNVKGLSTTATLDKSTDEWIINSPSLESGKFWPGELAIYGTHTVLYADMIIDGKSYGIQAFMV